MNGETLIRPLRMPIRTASIQKNVVRSLIISVSLMAAITTCTACYVLSYDKVYKGVYINSIYVGNKSNEELNTLLNENFSKRLHDSIITLKVGDYEEKISYADLDISYDTASAMQKVLNIGRNGNVVDKLHQIIDANVRDTKIEVPFIFNKKLIEDTVAEIYNKTAVSIKAPELIIDDKNVSIQSGHSGRNIDKNSVINEITEFIADCKSGVIDIKTIETPIKMDVEEVFKKINVQSKDANIKVSDGSIEFINHVSGRSVEKTELTNIINGLNGKEDTLIDVPVKITEPKVTLEALKAMLFKDTLQTQSSTFFMRNTIEKNRASNIRKAVGAINGTILAPGETFSFNSVVGQRTEARGYLSAYVFIGGKMVEDTGGGICQVASTLHRSVLYSDLEIVERQCHQFKISYVDNGTDAAVFWDSKVDYKFKNNTSYPIKIIGGISGNQVVFTLKGTQEDTDKTIEIQTVQTKEYPITTRIDANPKAEVGTPDIQDNSSHLPATGADITTYKIVKNAGVTTKKQIYTSHYNPYPIIMLRGTKPKAVVTEILAVTPAQTAVPQPTTDITPQPATSQPATPQPATPQPTAPT